MKSPKFKKSSEARQPVVGYLKMERWREIIGMAESQFQRFLCWERDVGQLHKECSCSLSSFISNSYLVFSTLSDIPQCITPKKRNPGCSSTEVLGKTHSLPFRRHGSYGQNSRGRKRARKLQVIREDLRTVIILRCENIARTSSQHGQSLRRWHFCPILTFTNQHRNN